jgi:ABC-2 type transport system ATP-binding protein
VRGTLSPEAARITAPMSDPDRVTDLLITLREAGIHLTEMSVQKPTLDEVFLTITGRPADAAATDSASADAASEEVRA